MFFDCKGTIHNSLIFITKLYTVLVVIERILYSRKCRPQDKYKAIPLFTSHVKQYYNKPGNWIQDLTKAIQSPKFNMEEYLGEYIKYMN